MLTSLDKSKLKSLYIEGPRTRRKPHELPRSEHLKENYAVEASTPLSSQLKKVEVSE